MNTRFLSGLTALAVAAALVSQTVAPLAVSASNDKSSHCGGPVPESKDAKHVTARGGIMQ